MSEESVDEFLEKLSKNRKLQRKLFKADSDEQVFDVVMKSGYYFSEKEWPSVRSKITIWKVKVSSRGHGKSCGCPTCGNSLGGALLFIALCLLGVFIYAFIKELLNR